MVVKEIIFGTTNPAKVDRFNSIVASLDIKFLSLKDVGIDVDIEERAREDEKQESLSCFQTAMSFQLELISYPHHPKKE